MAESTPRKIIWRNLCLFLVHRWWLGFELLSWRSQFLVSDSFHELRVHFFYFLITNTILSPLLVASADRHVNVYALTARKTIKAKFSSNNNKWKDFYKAAVEFWWLNRWSQDVRDSCRCANDKSEKPLQNGSDLPKSHYQSPAHQKLLSNLTEINQDFE